MGEEREREGERKEKRKEEGKQPAGFLTVLYC